MNRPCKGTKKLTLDERPSVYMLRIRLRPGVDQIYILTFKTVIGDTYIKGEHRWMNQTVGAKLQNL